MNQRFTRAAALGLAAFALVACADEPSAPTPSIGSTPGLRSNISPVSGSYVLMTSGGKFSGDLAAAVAAAGGTLKSEASEIGVAFAASEDPGFAARAAKIKGVGGVFPDIMVQWVNPTEGEQYSVEADIPAPGASAPGGFDESFWNAQWNVPAIDADDAHAAGNTGAGVRVAILDGGIHRTHVDLDARIDQARSRSFIPTTTSNFDWFQDIGTFWHGTHVAGIVAAEDNEVGTIGVAPSATLIGVKVLHNGSGAFEWIISGIVYAATPIAEGGAGADIINMSLGAAFLRGPNDGSPSLLNALNRATSYARGRGVLVLAATGNNGVDFDHTNHAVSVPAQSVGVVAIGATAPVGWKAIGATNFSDWASYSNYGKTLVSLSAPGGDDAYPGNELCSVPRIPSGPALVNPCWVFDLVLSTSRGATASVSSYSWAAGTSMASPAAAGVAALILGKYPSLSVQQLEQRLRKGAVDAGTNGNDAFHGQGWVNAMGSLQ